MRDFNLENYFDSPCHFALFTLAVFSSERSPFRTGTFFIRNGVSNPVERLSLSIFYDDEAFNPRLIKRDLERVNDLFSKCIIFLDSQVTYYTFKTYVDFSAIYGPRE